MATASNNASTKPTQTGWLAGVKAWLRQGRVEDGITSEEAIAIGRKYYEERGCDTTPGFHAEESAQIVDGVKVAIFEVSMAVKGGNGFVHVRRTDGKVIGYTSRPR